MITIHIMKKRLSILLGLSTALLAQVSLAQYQVIPEPANIKLSQSTTKKLNIIQEKKNAQLGPEAYKLTLTPKGSIIEYSTPVGRSFAIVTLEQLSDQLKTSPDGIPTSVISDQPTLPWRGMMIDVARHYMPMKDIKTLVDTMHFYKLNKLHIHLTDDQGWRLPIPGYPKLKTISSKREEMEGNKTPSEGMYTKEELKALVKYCADRGIEVIPEIDVPGHNQALAAAYPEFFCSPEPGLKVRTTAGVSKDLLCPQKTEGIKFMGAVFDELKDIFPSKIVHLGGDEAPTDKWQTCPLCKEARAKKNQKDCHDQMRDFFETMTQMLVKRGKEPQFWYEDNASIYKKGQTVFTWRMGKTPSTIKHTHDAGLKLILAPGEHCYFDYPQLPQHNNRGWMGRITLEQAYNLDPTYQLPKDQNDHIVGVHCTMWTEYLPTMDQVLYRAYPRAMALAEKGWTPKESWSWDKFQQKVQAHKPSFEKRFNHSLERTPDNEKPFK